MKKFSSQPDRSIANNPASRLRRIHVLVILFLLAGLLAFVPLIQQTKVTASTVESVLGHAGPDRAVMGERITANASGRGNPWINLKDGREVVTAYDGPAELTEALERNQVRPLSLSSADYDEDGVPDLITGYAGPEGGIITLLRGNVDAIYPNAPEAKQRRATGTFTNAPFLSPALVFAVPEMVDFVGSGDFDGDSHYDVVVGARESNSLFLLPGNGNGGFAAARQIALSGRITALTTGEINRPDGLDDIIVGIHGNEGSKALIFEGPAGALRAKPEIINLPSDATSFALGQLYGEYAHDLALAAGNELIVVKGRDRKLSLGVKNQSAVAKPVFNTRSFHSPIVSISSGDFRGGQATDLAVLSDDGSIQVLSVKDGKAGENSGIKGWQSEVVNEVSPNRASLLIRTRLSSTPKDTLVALDAKGNDLHVWSNETAPSLHVQTQPVAVLPMRLNEDALSDLVILTNEQISPNIIPTAPTNTFVVTNTNDKGAGSLRAAILNANSGSGSSVITFNIPGAGIPTIKPERALPTINHAVSIDGTTQAAGLVEIDGVNAGGEINGLDIKGGNTVVRGMVINSFRPIPEQNGIVVILFEGYAGISLTSKGGNIIEGNYIGPDETGQNAADLQLIGIMVFGSSDNTIGGTVPAARNVVSGNLGANITITTLRPHSKTCCIPIHEFVNLETTRNVVQGNHIGVDVTGTKIVHAWLGIFPNFSGIGIRDGAFGNVIGGTVPGAGNLISGGILSNVEIFDSVGNVVQGNLIGTVTDTSLASGRLPSSTKSSQGLNSTLAPFGFTPRSGVIIADPDGPAADNTIGGTTAAAGNTISTHEESGVEIVNTQSTGNQIQGNIIVDNTVGIRVADSPDTTIGGAEPGAGNNISGNGTGITIGFGEIASSDGTTITVESFIGQVGVTVQGNSIEANGGSGIFVEAESLINTVEDNQIAFNGGNGISIPNFTSNGSNPGIRIVITGNSIFSNGSLGIDLGTGGVTPNDDGNPGLGIPPDLDPGANLLQNFPELSGVSQFLSTNVVSGAIVSVPTTDISGTLKSTPNSTFTIEFFLGSACNSSSHQLIGSTPVFLGPTTVTTNGSGIANYNFSFPTGGGGFVIATATDVNGNTSEFSQCLAVSAP